jgi:hypothetical protein
LAKRLTRRGVSLSIAALVATLTRNATACVPAAVTSSTVKVALLIATGNVTATGAISANVAALTHGVGQAMLATKFKLVTVAVLMLGALGLTFGLATGQPAGNGPDPKPGRVVGGNEKVSVPPVPDAGGGGTKTGAPDQPAKVAGDDETPTIHGVVKEIDGDSIVLTSGKRVLLNAETKYLHETGLDATSVQRSHVTKGMRIYIGATKGPGGQLIANQVVIELLWPARPKGAEGGDNEPKQKDYFRTSVEARGVLKVTKERPVTVSGIFNDQPIGAVLHGVPLFFGGDKDLIELAKKLDGQTVILTGSMETDVPGGPFSPGFGQLVYVRVKTLKAAETRP